MDTKLRSLENKLDLKGTDRSWCTIIMHTNTNPTRMYNAKQIGKYFTRKLYIDTYGRHTDSADDDGCIKSSFSISDLDSVKQAFGSGFTKRLYSNKPLIALWAFNTMVKIGKYAQRKHHLNGLRAINKFQSSSNSKEAVSLGLMFYGKTKDRVNDLMWLYTLSKHPNFKSIPSHFSTMADPIGIPAGETPREATKNTEKYIDYLKKQTLISPKGVIRYCKKRLDQLNKKIINIKNAHKGIHYKKFLTNDNDLLRDLHYRGMKKGFAQWKAFSDKPKNYHEALYGVVNDKIPFARLMDQIKCDRNNNQSHPCFKSDITSTSKYDHDGGFVHTHRDSDPDEINDYCNYVVAHKPII